MRNENISSIALGIEVITMAFLVKEFICVVYIAILESIFPLIRFRVI